MPVSDDRGAPTLCVVVPVLNERDNIAPMVERLRAALAGIAWEVIFVDDASGDGTPQAVAAIGALDRRVRLLRRIGRRGLASAFVEGAEASLATYIAAIDGDLQHDEALLPRMLAALQAGGADIVVGSRYVAEGGLGDWNRARAGMSSLATRIARATLRVEIADPMSGFFMLPRPVLDAALPRLSAIGFKILLDLIASLPTRPRVLELPYQFRQRAAGESKLDFGVLVDFAMLLADKAVGRVLPVRFLAFALVGALGLVLHVIVLRLGLLTLDLPFRVAQGVATGVAIVANFWLNNLITFRDQRLKGGRAWRGLAVFALVCAVGAVANLNVSALLLTSEHRPWYAAGIAGALMSLVWNYAVGSTLTWSRR